MTPLPHLRIVAPRSTAEQTIQVQRAFAFLSILVVTGDNTSLFHVYARTDDPRYPAPTLPPSTTLYVLRSQEEADEWAAKDSTLLGRAEMPTGERIWLMAMGQFELPAATSQDPLPSAAPALLAEIEREYAELADVHNNWPGRDTLEGQAKLCRLRDLIVKATGRSAQEVQDDYGTRAARARAKTGERHIRVISELRIASGTKLDIDGETYTLVEVYREGGFNLANSAGRYVLTQAIYPNGLPTMADLNRMLKHLP